MFFYKRSPSLFFLFLFCFGYNSAYAQRLITNDEARKLTYNALISLSSHHVYSEPKKKNKSKKDYIKFAKYSSSHKNSVIKKISYHKKHIHKHVHKRRG